MQPLDEMAKTAVKLLQKEIKSEKVTGSYKLPVKLRVSSSLK